MEEHAICRPALHETLIMLLVPLIYVQIQIHFNYLGQVFSSGDQGSRWRYIHVPYEEYT